jgi:hypothetical protein
MTKIICRQSECVYWENSLCSSDEIVYDPEQGCLTFEPLEGFIDEEEWEEEDIYEEEDWEEEEDLLDEDEEEDEEWDL